LLSAQKAAEDMNEPPPSFWFPAKTYGWGWGLPVKWQGWIVLVGYFALQYLGIQHFKAERNIRALLTYLLVLTVILVAIVILKGERTARSR
jgi:hypothetical protein